jgi:hypothetical protein
MRELISVYITILLSLAGLVAAAALLLVSTHVIMPGSIPYHTMERLFAAAGFLSVFLIAIAASGLIYIAWRRSKRDDSARRD